MSGSGAAKGGRGCSPLLLGIILLVLAVLIVLPILAANNPQLLAHIEAALNDGRSEVITGTPDELEVDRAVGFMISAIWNGEELPDERYDVDEGIITIFDENGRVLSNAPLDEVHRPKWQALSPWERVGFWPKQDDGTLIVTDVRADGPAAAEGLRIGDVIEKCDGWPAAMMGLRSALIWRLPGGELELTVRRDGQAHTLSVTLPELMPAELLAGSSDPLGDWRAYAASPAD